MIDIKYANAYSEVLEILKYIPIEEYNKVPKSKIELFETNASNEYIFKYDPSKTLNQQDVSKIAKGIIAILFRDYWATEVQRNTIIAKQNYDRFKLEEKKREKYNPDKIFINNNRNINIDSIEDKQEVALVEINDMKWYKKVWRFIKDFFRK